MKTIEQLEEENLKLKDRLALYKELFLIAKATVKFYAEKNGPTAVETMKRIEKF